VPELNELHQKYAKDGLVLIGLHSDAGTDKGVEAAKAEKMKYPVAFDGGAFMKKVGCDSFPDYVIVDRKGIVRVVDLANSETERAVKVLLKEKP
jgi:Redoxin.